MTRLTQWLNATVITLVAYPTIASAQSLTWLPQPWGSSARAWDVSDDGCVVVGDILPRGSLSRGFWWSRQQGLHVFGTPGIREGYAYAVSADGRVAVGVEYETYQIAYAYRWTLENGVQRLGDFGSPYSYARDVSGDGGVIVGSAHLPLSALLVGFRWTATEGIQRVSPLYRWHGAQAVNRAGTIISGILETPGGGYWAICWLEEGAQRIFGYSLPPRVSGSLGTVITSEDGQIIVMENARESQLPRIYWWEFGSSPLDIGDLGGGMSLGGISGDGSIIVAEAFSGNERRAVRWVIGRGLEDLNNTYAHLLGDGSSLLRAASVSVDGRYIVGTGWNGSVGRQRAFLLDTWRYGDTNGDGALDDCDLLNVLLAFGTPGTGYTRHEDINKDGAVDDADLLLILFEFGDGSCEGD